MERIATVGVDISPKGSYSEILMKLDLYVDGVYKEDKRYFIAPHNSWNPSTKIHITDEEAERFLQRMITSY